MPFENSASNPFLRSPGALGRQILCALVDHADDCVREIERWRRSGRVGAVFENIVERADRLEPADGVGGEPQEATRRTFFSMRSSDRAAILVEAARTFQQVASTPMLS